MMKLTKKTNIQQESPNTGENKTATTCQPAASNSQRVLELTQAGLLGDIPLREFDRYEGTGTKALDTDWLDHMEVRESSRGDMCLPPPGAKTPVLSPAKKEKTSRKSPPENDN